MDGSVCTKDLPHWFGLFPPVSCSGAQAWPVCLPSFRKRGMKLEPGWPGIGVWRVGDGKGIDLFWFCGYVGRGSLATAPGPHSLRGASPEEKASELTSGTPVGQPLSDLSGQLGV